MKKIFLLCLVLLVLNIGCATTENTTAENDSSDESVSLNEENTVNVNSSNISNSNVLIAYFTWADNTTVENPESIDVDATTSASVLPPGNTEIIAEFIHNYVDGDIFKIITEESYSSDYNECLDRANEEKATNARPKLKNNIENIDEYDVVFLGYPNWWYTCPMAIFTFLEEYDFSNKTIIPFCAHGTGGLAKSIDDIKKTLPNSEILEPFDVYRPDTKASEENVILWLEDLGFNEKNN